MAILAQKRVFVGYSTALTNSKQQQFVDVELVKRDLLNHFNTIPGERVMMPLFGCGIWNLLFEPFDEATREAVIAEATKVILSDSRVNLQDIAINEYDHGMLIQLTLMFLPFNVIDTFSVEFDRRSAMMA
jgi:phage baseplate assembly protein W